VFDITTQRKNTAPAYGYSFAGDGVDGADLS
jgi:hypothetical protein